MDSILNLIKKNLGISEDCSDFDADVIMHINTAISKLYQLGLDNSSVLIISDANANWSDLTTDLEVLPMCQSMIYYSVKLVFDPPPSAAGIESMENKLAEMENRINTHCETSK